MHTPTIISGQAESKNATAPAAIITPTFAATSLREHSKVLLILTLNFLNRHNMARQAKFASKAIPPKISISWLEGGLPLMSLETISVKMIKRRQE